MQQAKRSSRHRAAVLGRERGRHDGYAKGRDDGYYMARCDHVIRMTPPENHPLRPIDILYVTAGIDVPYPALDQSIIEGFDGLVRSVTSIGPGEDVVKLAKQLNPDLVLALNGVAFPAEQTEAIRRCGIPLAVWFTDDPYYTDWTITIAPRYDYIFTLELSCIPFYEQLGCRHVYYLPFAANPAFYKPQRIEAAYRSDICFIGTAFWNRVELIDSIADLLHDKKIFIAGWWWDRLKSYSQLSDSIRLGEWLSPEETAKYYHGAKLVINLHRTADDHTLNFNQRNLPAYSINPRTFEIAASGTLQLVDPRHDLKRYYVEGKEIITFANSEQLRQWILYYLDHPAERDQVALNALHRTRRNHTYRDRLAEMLAMIFDSKNRDDFI